MSKTLLIVIIVVASIVVLFALLFLFGKISSARKKKKTMTGELAKKIAKIKKEQKKNQQNASTQPKDDFILEEKKYVPETVVPEKKHKKIQPIISDYDEFDDSSLAPKVEQAEPVKRKSFEELMKSRNQAREQQELNQVPPTDEIDDDFEKFRASHSVFTSYQKDQTLVEEIQGLSPELKAIVFGNLFRRISDD